MAPRRTHTKSRNGCDQCKRRRVKVSLESVLQELHSINSLPRKSPDSCSATRKALPAPIVSQESYNVHI